MKKRLIVIVAVVMMMSTGCSNQITPEKDMKVVLTTGFAKDEIFRIEKMSCSVSEVMIYLMNTKNQYENTFGSEIWEVTKDGESLQGRLKETVLARLARIKALNLMAQQQGISLAQEELLQVQTAAEAYVETLSEHEKSTLQVTKELITEMYQERALADKIYDYLIADINPEISDDEARTITVMSIFIKTYHLDENGTKQSFSTQSKNEAYEKAKEAWSKAKEGENFETLISTYSDAEESVYSFGKGSMEETIEQAAFELGNQEISKIITTEDGYYILKCISTFDREETDRNKLKIVEQRRKEVFDEEYSTFIKGLTRTMNDKLWDTVTFVEDEEVTTSSFFDIYQEYMKQSETD